MLDHPWQVWLFSSAKTLIPCEVGNTSTLVLWRYDCSWGVKALIPWIAGHQFSSGPEWQGAMAAGRGQEQKRGPTVVWTSFVPTSTHVEISVQMWWCGRWGLVGGIWVTGEDPL